MEEVPRNPEEISRWILQTIQRSRNPKGLAILIARSGGGSKGLSEVKQDLFALRETFNKLNFTIMGLLNPIKIQLVAVIMSVMSLQDCGIKWPSSWKRIVVAYSGPGHEVVVEKPASVNDSEEKITIDDIVYALTDCKQEQLMAIPKIFFMDYDRGIGLDTGLELVSRGSGSRTDTTPHSNPFQIQQVVARGNGNRIPSRGNYLKAYATQAGMKSHSSHEGSCWIQMISKFLVDENLIDLDVENIFKRVNFAIIRQMGSTRMHFLQQPEYISTLNEDVKLLKEAREVHGIQQQQQQLIQHGAFPPEEQPSQQQLPQLGQQQQQEPTQDFLVYPEWHYQHQEDFIMNPPPELSPESLQKLDPAVVEEFLSDSISGIQMGQQDVMMAPDSAAFTVPAPQPTYNNGLCLEGYVAQQEIKGRGEENGKKLSKTPKTILKEHFERKSKGKVEIQYKTKESSNGYRSSVVCPGVGSVSGELQSTKKEAENSAAVKALNKLDLLA